MAITYHAGRRIQGLAPADETSTQYDTPVSSMTIYSSNGSTATHTTGEHFTATKWRNLELKSITVRQSRYNSSSSGSLLCQVFGSDHVTQIGSTITGTPSNASSLLISGGGYSSSTYTLVTYDLTGITSPNTEWFIAFGTLASGSAPAYVSYDTSNDGDGSNKWESYNGYSDEPSKHVSFELVYVGGDAKPTNVQVGSRWEETDTRKMYHYNAPTLTFEDDFSSDTWTGCKNNACDSGAPTTVTISGGDLSAVSVNVASDDRMVKALGLTLSNTAWIYQFETNVSSTGTHTGLVGLVSSGGNMNNTSILCDYNGSNKIIMREYNSGLTEMGSGISISTGTQYYVTVIRTSLTGLTLEVRTGSHTGSHVSGSPESGTITGATGLTHVQSGAYGRGSGTATYDIDNIEIYNGVTSTDNAWKEEGT